jgi:hypothetical protein
MVVLAALLLAFVAATDPGRAYSSDEGAAILQARVLDETGSWHYEYPLSWLSDARAAMPFVRGNVGTEGVAPYAKHPLYPALIWSTGGGAVGALALSLAGAVAAAGAAAAVARRLSGDRWAPIITLWSVGVASPLLIDAGLALAHTLAAASFTLAVACLLRMISGSDRWRWAIVGGLVGSTVAVLLRTESVLALAAMGLATIVALRSRRALVAGGTLLVSAGLGYVVDRCLLHSIVGVSLPTPPNTVTSGLRGRWDGLYVTWLSTGTGRSQPWAIAAWCCLAALLVGAVLLRRRRIRSSTFVAVTVAVGATYVLRLVVSPDEAIPGLLVAAPVLVALAGFVQVSGSSAVWRAIALGSSGGAGFILLTQYSIGGGVEWGGRYFAVLLPIATAVIVVGAVAPARRAVPSLSAQRVLLVVSAVTVFAVGAIGLSVLRSSHLRADDLALAIDRAAAQLTPEASSGRPVVVTSNRLLPQLLHPDFDNWVWVAASGSDITGIVEELPAHGVREVVLVVPDSEVPQLLADRGWSIRRADTSAVYDVVLMERQR